METACNYIDSTMFVSTDENKWKRKIETWAKEYPDQCKITTRPEDNDGCMCAKMPASWFRMRPPIKRKLTDEQKEEMVEKMRLGKIKQKPEDEEEEADDQDA